MQNLQLVPFLSGGLESCETRLSVADPGLGEGWQLWLRGHVEGKGIAIER